MHRGSTCLNALAYRVSDVVRMGSATAQMTSLSSLIYCSVCRPPRSLSVNLSIIASSVKTNSMAFVLILPPGSGTLNTHLNSLRRINHLCFRCHIPCSFSFFPRLIFSHVHLHLRLVLVPGLFRLDSDVVAYLPSMFFLFLFLTLHLRSYATHRWLVQDSAS